MLQRSAWSEKGKEKWMKVFTSDLHSSEESDENDGEIIIVKPLPWRSERVTEMFHRLDEKIDEGKSAQAKRQKRRRVMGVEPSARPQPPGLPKWAVTS